MDYTTPLGEDEERQQTATITVLATPEQALLLTRFENEGVLHVALISRGNEKLSEELLGRQSEILSNLYGGGMELPDDSPELSGSDGDDSQGNSPADFGKPADTKQDTVPENISGTE